MSIASGTRLGPYEIVSPLGAGGMGEVWKARDTRLDRDVAIKLLPALFTHDEQFRARFEREAKTISSLNHPNICTLYDVGQSVITQALQGGEGTAPESAAAPRRETTVHYLVMELIEGESLADRISRGPLPLDQVLKIGAQVADALDRAHRQGIVHRDLKPGNVMLTKTGAKLLDFGLAHVSAVATSRSGSQTMLPTQGTPLTAEGVMLGTFQYMAPEQIEGLEPDPRTDIFSLGAVLYEMATGRRAFQGKSRTSLIAAIISTQPEPISSITKVSPPALDHVVKKCLEKDPEDRWQSAHDVAGQLRWMTESGSQAALPSPGRSPRKSRELFAWTTAAVCLVGALGMAAALALHTSPTPPALRATLQTPAGKSLFPFDVSGLALSPDGRELAYVASGSDTKRSIWIRKLSEMSSHQLPETDAASYPFWSPDGLHVAFFAEGKLKVIDLRGGSPRTIAEAPTGRGGSWSKKGMILFAPNISSPIQKVKADGGETSPVTTFDEKNHVTHRWPVFLPDGEHFLYVIRVKRGGSEVGQLMLGSLGSREGRLLIDDSTNAAFAPPGYIIFGRSSNLFAWRFDLKSLKLTGQPAPIAPEKLSYWEAKNLVPFAVSKDGTLVYLPETSSANEMRWFDREGRSVGLIGTAGFNSTPRISPDGTKIAFMRSEVEQGQSDVWVRDLGLDRAVRITQKSGQYFGPEWSPDSQSLVFVCQPRAVQDLCLKSLRDGAEPKALFESSSWKTTGSWLPKGDKLLFTEQDPETNEDIKLLSLGGKSEVSIVLKTPFAEDYPEISPDGHWIAYISNQTGRSEIYVRALEGRTDQWQISSDGGVVARWSHDGKSLFYASSDGQLMETPVKTGPEFQPGTPHLLFKLPAIPTSAIQVFEDVAPDGKRFLLTVPTQNQENVGFFVTSNWTSLLSGEAKE